jgi:hypothetical protein
MEAMAINEPKTWNAWLSLNFQHTNAISASLKKGAPKQTQRSSLQSNSAKESDGVNCWNMLPWDQLLEHVALEAFAINEPKTWMLGFAFQQSR